GHAVRRRLATVPGERPAPSLGAHRRGRGPLEPRADPGCRSAPAPRARSGVEAAPRRRAPGGGLRGRPRGGRVAAGSAVGAAVGRRRLRGRARPSGAWLHAAPGLAGGAVVPPARAVPVDTLVPGRVRGLAPLAEA